MAAVPIGELGRKLHNRMLANRTHLFLFMTNRAAPYTNNVSERHLRPSVIFRKVTNGFRCQWGAEAYAAFRSVVSKAKANGGSIPDTVQFVLSTEQTRKTESYTGIEGVSEQDACIQDSQGLIADRATEHLGPTDMGVIRIRMSWHIRIRRQ